MEKIGSSRETVCRLADRGVNASGLFLMDVCVSFRAFADVWRRSPSIDLDAGVLNGFDSAMRFFECVVSLGPTSSCRAVTAVKLKSGNEDSTVVVLDRYLLASSGYGVRLVVGPLGELCGV
jgi:hypothetical protein